MFGDRVHDARIAALALAYPNRIGHYAFRAEQHPASEAHCGSRG
jgi:hypothetical protein